MLFLERDDRWYYAAFPVAIVWANLHASVALAPAIVLARLAGALATGGVRSLRSNRDLVMLPAVLLAHALHAVRRAAAGVGVEPCHEPDPPLHSRVAAAELGQRVVPLRRVADRPRDRRGRRRDADARQDAQLPGGPVVYCGALCNPEHGVVCDRRGAARGARFGRALPADRRSGARRRGSQSPLAASRRSRSRLRSAAFAMVKIQARQPAPMPLAAIERLAADGASHRLFCENFTWCSAALQHPTLRVFIDGRCDAYPLPVWKSYVATIQTRPAWSSALRYGVDTVIAGRGALESALASSPHWGRTYRDGAYVVFRRD